MHYEAGSVVCELTLHFPKMKLGKSWWLVCVLQTGAGGERHDDRGGHTRCYIFHGQHPAGVALFIHGN